MILIINLNKYKFHDLEFIQPITDLLENCKVIHYRSLTQKDIDSADRVIIAGTSLKDSDYLQDLDNFSWIKNYKKPLLGICAGMQILALVHGAKLKKAKEIGVTQLKKKKVYSLHQFSITLPKGFEKLDKSSKCIHEIKKDDLYGVLFHPEVMNKEIIENFALN
jgi:GMP synthase-like glutamine amidotransferase